ncbi:hypothetical protein KUTeg_005139 [Tegillarca granosa]|uniref:RRM domain-containing protein n=1 Tax=Tegillarca granosa TaxID=220873 RepID=A0ABQ9FNE7_TEGGR|nr:hypothetical protein KUTeg_005139 [Tegillarca granosa]
MNDIKMEDSCSFELDPNYNPTHSMESVTAEWSLLPQAQAPVAVSGIEATDVRSLLEQFEEDIKLTDDLIKKIRAKIKRKSAIMLPMGTPSKNGRGSATVIPVNQQTSKLQKLMLQKSQSADNLKSLSSFQPEPDSSSNLSTASEGSKPKKSVNTGGKFEVSNDYYDLITDHDYCVNSIKPGNSVDSSKTNVDKFSEMYPEEDILDLEDGEINDLDFDKENQNDSRDSGIHEPLTSSEKTRQSRTKRNYRNKREDSPENTGDEKYFDKIPSYYTALSLSSKPPKKNSSKSVNQSRITDHDFIQRDPSPTRDSSLCSKIPAYHSCFTNSTKYDSRGTNNDELSIDFSQESKLSSGYSSRSYSPSDMITSSRHCSRSRSRSWSRSRSHSRSRSPNSSSKLREERMRGRRRRRRGSYSSDSRSRSRSSDYSRSRSRSFSRSRSRSRSRRSRSRSRSVLKRNNSIERRRQERQKMREEEKKVQIEERRIVYVGKIPADYTKSQLRRRFCRFGEIEEVSTHFREAGDNYGFVTFAYTCDAYAAVEKGNAIPGEQHFDLCFGGRRQFCDTEYADLDGNMEMQEEFDTLPQGSGTVDFDELLKQAVKQASGKS